MSGLQRGTLGNMEDRYDAEEDRIAEALAGAIRDTDLSVRAVERRAGVSYTLFHKVLTGRVALRFRHILMILDALQVNWTKFFQACYPPGVSPEDKTLEDRVRRALVSIILEESQKRPELGPVRKRGPAKKAKKKAAAPAASRAGRSKRTAGV
jgi:hypothetical protein